VRNELTPFHPKLQNKTQSYSFCKSEDERLKRDSSVKDFAVVCKSKTRNKTCTSSTKNYPRKRTIVI